MGSRKLLLGVTTWNTPYCLMPQAQATWVIMALVSLIFHQQCVTWEYHKVHTCVSRSLANCFSTSWILDSSSFNNISILWAFSSEVKVSSVTIFSCFRRSSLSFWTLSSLSWEEWKKSTTTTRCHETTIIIMIIFINFQKQPIIIVSSTEQIAETPTFQSCWWSLSWEGYTFVWPCQGLLLFYQQCISTCPAKKMFKLFISLYVPIK